MARLLSAIVCLLCLTGHLSAQTVHDIPLDCQTGWTLIGAQCYKLYTDVLPWDSAHQVCQSYGSHLVQVKDYYDNEDVGTFVKGQGVTEYWIGAMGAASRAGTQQNDERALYWGAGSDRQESSVAVGHWSNGQPDATSGHCVLVATTTGKALWARAPCERKSAYVCQRNAAPTGSFHCHNGRFVQAKLACDGDDDCGDGSDETNCNNLCSYHMRQMQSGSFASINSPNLYPNNRTCTWLIEVPLGYNARLQFTEFHTESRSDEVMVLAGGMTESTSHLVARLSGNLSAALPVYTSYNNFLTVIFAADNSNSNRGFRATYTAVKDTTFPARKVLEATNSPQTLMSPLYPGYLGSQDYTWVIRALEKRQIVTLEIVEADLKPGDRVLVRDGDMVFHDLLANLTSESGATPPYVLSTGRDLYVVMQTRGVEGGRGFTFRYWQGCKVTLNETSGEIHSPGYKAADSSSRYGAFQTCTYNVTVPGAQHVTVRFDRLKLHPSDEVMIYEGSQLLHNITGSSPPPPFQVTSGAFRVVFDSDAIQTDEGFSITYSIACSNPLFNNFTVVSPATSDFRLGTRVSVGCKTGHALAALEFQDTQVQDAFQALSSVTLECLPGAKWNLRTLPVCEPDYCGQAPPVTNAYVLTSTGVTYQAVIRYQCYPGFVMSGQADIMCTDTGGWTNTPSCKTSACPQGTTIINNGDVTLRSGDGSNFSTIYDYACQPGYTLVGAATLFCQSNGMWSANVPRCEAVKCFVPQLANGQIGQSGLMVDVGVTLTATCIAGYIFNPLSSALPVVDTIQTTCSFSGSLPEILNRECIYHDKCSKDPNYCGAGAQQCQDSEFTNVTCTCLPGYSLGQDMRSCQNVDECANASGGCDHDCRDTIGGYTCTCRAGFVLFTSEGVQGYSLARNEDGNRSGDVRRLNHSCLPVKCPAPPVVSNGTLMENRPSYHYGDFIEYTCPLGFKLSGFSLLKCNALGQWDNAAPQCTTAVCLPDTLPSSLVNPATVTPGGQVPFGGAVTLTCRVPGKPVETKTRRCIFFNGQYSLVGASYECGLVNCGLPEVVSGSEYGSLDASNTTYGSSLIFGCQNLYSVQGSSEAGDRTVRCLSTGRWDFGSLRCAGISCTDPGTPPDGQQVNATSYEQGDKVYYSCNRAGFNVSTAAPLTCQLNAAGNSLMWSAVKPACVDVQPPMITNCPTNVSVARFTSASAVAALTPPIATDNVYVSKYRLTDALGNAIWPSSDLVLSRMTIINLAATDHAGLTAACTTVVSIIDDTPPTISCPPTMIREFGAEGSTLLVTFLSSDVNTSGDAGTPVFSPPSVTLSASSSSLNTAFPPFQSVDVTATTQDRTGNAASCVFELHYRPAACSPLSLRTPLHGGKSCSATTGPDGFRCTLTCDPGYVFYSDSTSPSLVRTCQSGDSWIQSDTPSCVLANTSSGQATFSQTFRFTFTQTEQGVCTDNRYQEILQPVLNLIVSSGQLRESCKPTAVNGEEFDGKLAITDILEVSQTVLVNVTLTYNSLQRAIHDACRNTIKVNFETDGLDVTTRLRDTFSPIGCPAITNSKAGVQVKEDYFCLSGKQIQYQPPGATAAIDVCVACPEGTRTVGNTCELCQRGTFTFRAGDATCVVCDRDRSTLRTGAVANAECIEECRSAVTSLPAGQTAVGTFSATGLPPCARCPKGTYSVNSTYCVPCPAGQVTRVTGATRQDQCLPACPIGHYNLLDGHGTVASGCTPCPLHHFANVTGSVQCTECSSNQRTDNPGSVSPDACTEVDTNKHPGCNASNNPCQNGGQCAISNHAVTCTCPDGYNGQYCQQTVSPCLSTPCYRSGTCTNSGNDFSCDCPAGTFGKQCQETNSSCEPDSCLNDGACRNDLNTFTCLCKAGFSGNRCQNTEMICDSSPCRNGGACVSLNNVRYRCDCPAGFTGQQCEVNIDDCAATPCLHGATCTDRVADYGCSCANGFTGRNCETRLSLCNSSACNGGQCIEDANKDTFRCVCQEGSYSGTVCQWDAFFGYDINGSVAWAFESSNSTVQECIANCDARSCRDFFYNPVNMTCQVVPPSVRISNRFGSSIYYFKMCEQVEESYWTRWYDSFMPNPNDPASADSETPSQLNNYGLNICGGSEAVAAECEVVGTRTPPSEILFSDCTPTGGLVCRNRDQPDGKCENYEIRFKCLSSRALSRSACMDIDYCSNSSACSSRGTCSELPTDFSCACQPGYSGSRCQHDFDNCASSPCQNSATCVDLFRDYRCECSQGYTGKNCDIMENKCFTISPCSLAGTQTCSSKLNGYECVCNPGFTGDRCETDVNECASQPCQHGGMCSNQVNGFRCNCSAGWTGPECRSLVQKCQPDTCNGSAVCSNLFDDFYCSCKPNTYGKTCSNGPSICGNANPCLHGSSCTESNGIAACKCTPEYLGNGCQLRRDVCSMNQTNPVCQNGASCTSTLTTFTCHCAPGYTGRYCDSNVDDCMPNTCHPASTCIDMVNTKYCRCPVGKGGSDCQKDVNREFDLDFASPQKTNMASLGYPLRLAGDGFSVTMWIQYRTKGGKGTFFTLYSVSSPNSLADKKEVVRIDDSGLVVTLGSAGSRTLNTTVNFREDGAWHYIALTWNRTTGLFAFFVDTVRIPLNDYNKGMALDLNVWMVLGCRYNVTTSRCVADEGFNGRMSQVSLYRRELLFTQELTVLGNTQPFVVFSDAVMTWGEFLQHPGVTRVYPSLADRSCPIGFTGTGCSVPLPGKTSVSAVSGTCPKDVIKYSASRVTQVAYVDPRFDGAPGDIKKTVNSGSVFLWGKYPVVIEATNDDGNKALCVFDIYVQYDQCTTPATPANARQVFCANFTDPPGRGYRQCSVTCNQDFAVVIPAPEIHTCGPVGSFDPPNKYLPYTLPPCGQTMVPKRRLVVVLEYNVPSNECPQVSQDIREQLMLRIREQNALWGNTLCRDTDCSDIELDIQCRPATTAGTTTGRKRRQAQNQAITVTLTADDVPALLTNTADPSLTRSPEDLLQQLVLSDDVFDFSNRVALATPDPNGLQVQVQLLCQTPTALSGDQCVECSAGTRYDNTTSSCVLCPVGTYQPLSGQITCVPCTQGTTTVTQGAVASSQCKTACPVGQYYKNDADECTLCPQGFYQNETGGFFCRPCPVDKTTRQPGATSSALCYNDCTLGKELTENGTCADCGIGSYKGADQTLCQPCPAGTVTNTTGGVTRQDCNVADNPPGYFRTRPNETHSEKCPIGTYQPLKWQYACLTCGGDRYRTDAMGADSRDDCKFFCPAGQERDGTEDKCKPCGLGYFRTGDNFYDSCELCPNNTRTVNTGSTNVSACSIYKCQAGYKPTAQDTCTKCPRGTYQPQPDQTDCLPCMGVMMDTRADGATLQMQCERYCPAGQEKLANGTCRPCNVGYFKDNAVDTFSNCTRCSDPRYVTPAEGATNAIMCTVLDCPKGQKISGNVCEVCPQGSYQDLPYQTNCKGCPTGMSTRNNASTSAQQCETYCNAGLEKMAGSCTNCERGYYKNNMNDPFMNCTLCPTEYVTPGLASTDLSQCTIRNCTAGSYISGTGCNMCLIGEYQPLPWQSECTKCGTDRTTVRSGATNQSECILSCLPGKENLPGTDACTPCPQGTYKVAEKAARCDQCPAGYTTRINGSTTSSDCNLRACAPGSYANGDMCTACEFEKYQPEKWQEGCLTCPSGFITVKRGATSSDDCIRNCVAGQEYINATKTCQPCSIGFYNDDLDPARYTCIPCPAVNITLTTGATAATDCNVPNCTAAGQYRDVGVNACRDCPRGQWQSEKWRTSCNNCSAGFTTQTTGSSSAQACLYDCASGQQLVGTTCTPCPVGTYRDKAGSWSWLCQPCAPGLTTRGTGTVARTDCSVSTCAIGKFFNTQSQSCEDCPSNSYQDQANQFLCKPCPVRTATTGTGAVAASQCVDRCLTTTNNCDSNAACASTASGVTCVCNAGYMGSGQTCTHMCDVVGHCQNGATCERSLKKCICKELYYGDTCDLRADPQTAGLGDKDIIIVAVVTTLAFLLFLILLIVCCCVIARKRQRNRVPFPQETSDERASIATRMSTRGFDDFGYGTKPAPFSAGPKMMLPISNQQLYENPTYTVSDGDPAVYKV